jgi:hypothetical protein
MKMTALAPLALILAFSVPSVTAGPDPAQPAPAPGAASAPAPGKPNPVQMDSAAKPGGTITISGTGLVAEDIKLIPMDSALTTLLTLPSVAQADQKALTFLVPAATRLGHYHALL